MRIRCLFAVLAGGCLATVNIAAEPNEAAPTQRVVDELNERLSEYLTEYTKLVARARDRFKDQAGRVAELAIRQLEAEAVRAMRDGELKAAGDAYYQILRINPNHAKARGHFEAIKQLDETLQRAVAEPHSIRPAGAPRSTETAEAWKEVLKLDRDHAAARDYFDKRGELRKVLAEIVPEPPQDAVEWNGHYYKVFDENLTWHQAAAKCEAMGGYLARIESEQENGHAFALQSRAAVGDCWIDGTDEQHEGKWLFSDGSMVRFTHWHEGEPNNGGIRNNEHRMILYAESARWVDVPSGKRRSYICEWPSREEQLK